MRAGLDLLARRLADERSREVVFVSHCLLDENTRYLGGAFHPGVVPDVVEALRRRGAGIHQMRCPSSAPGAACSSAACCRPTDRAARCATGCGGRCCGRSSPGPG